MSQPPLSTQIRLLEESMGVKLLERTSRRVDLTDAGSTLLVRAREILSAVEDARDDVRGIETGARGRLDIGFISTATLGILPQAVRRLRDESSGISLELHQLCSSEQIHALYEREIRVGLVRLPLQAEGIKFTRILGEPLHVALPKGHSLERLAEIPIEEIADLPLIFIRRRQAPGLHGHIVNLFDSHGISPHIVQYAMPLLTLLGLVASGVGAAILPSSGLIPQQGISYRRLDVEGGTSWLALAELEEETSALIEVFRKTVQAVAAEAARMDSRLELPLAAIV